TMMFECAGQNPVGFHCTTRSLSQENDPAGVAGESNLMVLSAAARFAIGCANVTVTGIAPPTFWSEVGVIDTTSVGVVTLAELVATDPALKYAAMPTTTSR